MLSYQTYSPGPLLFWLLAVPARFLGPSSLAVTVGLLGVASVVGTVGLAHRHGGRPLMFAVAVAIPIMLASHPAETYSDVFNSSAPLLPFTLLIFMAWSLACGDYRLLPLTVLVASFSIQSHLTFVAPVVAVMIIGLLGLVASRRAARRWIFAAIAVGMICWAPPVIEEATNSPGNLALLRLAATADEATLGFEAGLRAVVHMVGLIPWWLQEPPAALGRLDDLSEAPGAVAMGSTLIVLAALAAVTRAGWRRRRPAIWAAAALGLGLCAAVAANGSSTPESAAETVTYTMRWAEPAGMSVWILLGWSLVMLTVPRRRRAAMRQHAARRPALALIGLAAAGATAAIVSARADLPDEPYEEMRIISDRLAEALPPGSPVRVESSFELSGVFQAVQFRAGTVYALRRQGRQVVVPSIARKVGDHYRRGPYEHLVRINVDIPPSERGRAIARFTVRESAYQVKRKRQAITVTAQPTPGAGL